jgi:hypothetical protein
MGNPMVESDFGYMCGKCLQIQWQIVYNGMDGAARCKRQARVHERAFLHGVLILRVN